VGTDFLVVIAIFGGFLGLLVYATRKSADAPMLPPPPPMEPESGVIPGSGDAKLNALARTLDLVRGVDEVRGEGPPRVSVEAKPHGAAELSQLVLNAKIEIRPPLGLRLRVGHRSLGALLGLSSTYVVVGERFDAQFNTGARHLDQARELLSGEIGDWILDLANMGASPRVDDDGVQLTMPGKLEEAVILDAVELAVHLAKELPKARARLQRPEIERDVLDALRPLALALGGRVDEERLLVEAEHELGIIEVDAESAGDSGWRTLFSATFARPLLCELRLTDRDPPARWALWKEADIELGDAAFDRAFVVRGEPEGEVKTAVSAEARQTLQKLSELTDGVSVDQSSVSAVVESLVLDTERAEKIVRAVLEVVRALTARTGADQGAYR
jgi:hypothetical protein